MLTGALTRQPGNDVGTYPILQGALTPRITTGRTPDGSDVKITPQTDGTYIIRIPAIRQMLTVNITFLPTANERVTTSSSVIIRTAEHNLYITTPTTGTAWIYNLTGTLIRSIPCPAGETVTTPLPPGLYIIKTTGRTQKVLIN